MGKSNSIFKNFRAWYNILAAKVLTLYTLGSDMAVSSNPGGHSSHPAPCLWPGKAVEESPKPWDLVPVWETWMKIQAPAFGSNQLLLLGELING